MVLPMFCRESGVLPTAKPFLILRRMLTFLPGVRVPFVIHAFEIHAFSPNFYSHWSLL
jgi:hypothetical protein